MNLEEIRIKLANLDLSKYPDFYDLKKPSDKALWILYVLKVEGISRRLSADFIANLIRDVMEISITSQSIYNSFNPLMKIGLIHKYEIDGEKYYEIMKPGKEHIMSLIKDDLLNILYFQPGERFSSKRLLSTRILEECVGDICIVDPYIGIRTLDIIRGLSQNVRFITKISNIRNQNQQSAITREINDFKSEFPNYQFRSYRGTDLHDRYIIADNILIISGYSLKDLGKKESFAIFLEKDNNIDTVTSIKSVFETKWLNSTLI